MSILITGCSSGIGLETAQYLTQHGFDVIATARDDKALATLKKLGIKTVHLDINHTDSIKKAVAEALILSPKGIDVLINNAGFGQAGALDDISRDMLRRQFETNVFGLLELTNAILPHMRAQGYGRIINISSVLGFISMPYRGAYNASKYALESLSDTLRLELKDSNIDVVLIQPGPIESNFRKTCVKQSIQNINIEQSQHKQRYLNLARAIDENKPIAFKKPAIAVSKKILKAIKAKKPKPRYQVTFPTHVFAVLKRILSTRLLDKLLVKT